MSQNLKLKHKEFFKIPRKAFTFIGIDPSVADCGAIIRQPVICYGLYILTFVYSLASINFCMKNNDDFNEFAMVISLLNQLIIALWKITIFLVKRRRIHKLIRDIWQWNENADDVDFQIISVKSNKNALLSRCYCMAVFLAGAVGLSLPLMMKLAGLFPGLDGVLDTRHIVTYFFWDTSTFPRYAAAFILNVTVTHFLANASIAIDTLFLWLVTNMVIRFCILKMHLKKAAEEYQEKKFLNVIKDCIKFHSHVLYLAEELDSSFAEIIFLKSLISCTQICFLAFCLMSKDTSLVTLFHPFTFLLSVSLQLILYCYNGNLIEDQSLSVSDTVFESFNWSQMSVPHQRMLQLIMLRSQKASHITGIFFNLNLNLYLWFYKSAGSLIAVLRTLEGGSK